MPDEDQQDASARLEPPRLFGRKKGRKTATPQDETPAPTPPEPDPRPEAESEVAPAPESEAEPQPELVAADTATTQVIEGGEPTEVVEPVEAVEEQPTEVLAPEPDPEAATVPAAPPVPPEEPAPALFADEVDPDGPGDDVEAAPAAAVAAKPAKDTPAKETKPPRAPREPLPGRVAAAVTGALVGLVLVGGTYLALRGCEAVQGTTSCGRAGFPLLALIFVAAILAGSVLLSRFAVPDATSTSFLATGMTAVVALLFLIDVIDHWSMVVVIPLVSVLTYLLSYWVTTTFIDPVEDPAKDPANDFARGTDRQSASSE
jgi:hypothetical protein